LSITGLPGWIEGAYFNVDYPQLVADFAGRLAERFKGRIYWYTPLNEPRVTAWYCGRLGWWPPYARSWRGFVAVMLSLAAGIQATARRLKEVDPEIVVYHVDATDLYESDDAHAAGRGAATSEHRLSGARSGIQDAVDRQGIPLLGLACRAGRRFGTARRVGERPYAARSDRTQPLSSI
jgi:hypothetical protein